MKIKLGLFSHQNLKIQGNLSEVFYLCVNADIISIKNVDFYNKSSENEILINQTYYYCNKIVLLNHCDKGQYFDSKK